MLAYVKHAEDGSVRLSKEEVDALKEMFEFLLTSRRLEAGWSDASRERYARFSALRRDLLRD